jgi:hypothetical protein
LKLRKRDPNSPEVIDAAIEMIRRMTPEEALAFLTYRTPGVEETDMTGMLLQPTMPSKTSSKIRRTATTSAVIPQTGKELGMPSPTQSSQPSDATTVAERGHEIADLLLRGLQEGVLAEQDQQRRLKRAERDQR